MANKTCLLLFVSGSNTGFYDDNVILTCPFVWQCPVAIWAAKCEPTKKNNGRSWVNEVQAHALLGRFQSGETQGGSDTGTWP